MGGVGQNRVRAEVVATTYKAFSSHVEDLIGI